MPKKDGSFVPMAISVAPAEGYKSFYAMGVQGSPLFNYHIRIDFYNDLVPPLNYVDPDGTGKLQVTTEQPPTTKREVLASVYVSLPCAKELKNWLEVQIKQLEAQYGEIALPQTNLEADKISQVNETFGLGIEIPKKSRSSKEKP
jgi:hypothetical protein